MIKRFLIKDSHLFISFYLTHNVAQRLDKLGQVTASERYDAWGNLVERVDAAGNDTMPVAIADPYGYNAQSGYYTDRETGLLTYW